MRRTTLIAPALLLLAACGGGATQDDSASLDLPAVQSSEATETTEPSPAQPATNDRGNLVKALGEDASITDENGDAVVTFAVDTITVDPACTSDYSEPAENGHFIAAAMRVSTASGVNDTLGYFDINPNSFSYIGPDGVTQTNLATFAAYACISDSEQFPSGGFGPGQQYVGTVVLDVPDTSGSLIFAPSGLGLPGGWEWTF